MLTSVQQRYGLDGPELFKERTVDELRDSATSATSIDTLEKIQDELYNMDLSDILANDDDNAGRIPVGRSKSCSHARRSNDSASSSHRRGLPKRSVSFDKVEIRTYERVLVDNPPSCAPGGPSLGLGWKYTDKKPVPVDKHVTKSVFQFSKIRRQKKDFLMSPEKREKIAKKLGFSNTEIQANAKQVERVLRQRKRTVDAYMNQQWDAVYVMQMARQAHGLSGRL